MKIYFWTSAQPLRCALNLALQGNEVTMRAGDRSHQYERLVQGTGFGLSAKIGAACHQNAGTAR